MGSIKSQRAHLNNETVDLKTIRSTYNVTIGAEENAAVIYSFLLLMSSTVSQFDSLCSTHVCLWKCVSSSVPPGFLVTSSADRRLCHAVAKAPSAAPHTPGHTPLSGRPQLPPMPHSDHFTQNLTSTHTHTHTHTHHTHTQGRVTAGTHPFLLGYGDDVLW